MNESEDHVIDLRDATADAQTRQDLAGRWDRSKLPANAVLHPTVWMESHRSFERFRSTRERALVIGADTRVYAETTFPLESTGRVEVGRGCLLVGVGFMAAELIHVGDRVRISYRVLIADSDFHPVDVEARGGDAVACAPEGDRSQRPTLRTRPVVIEDDVTIGPAAMIMKGVTIGAGAEIGAGSVVTADVPAGAFVAGNPARVTEWAQG
jgi:acetyltransferase-like isoleucine patch superfamily enzyme